MFLALYISMFTTACLGTTPHPVNKLSTDVSFSFHETDFVWYRGARSKISRVAIIAKRL